MGYKMDEAYRPVWRPLAGSGPEARISIAVYVFGLEVAGLVLDEADDTRGQAGFYYYSVAEHLKRTGMPVNGKTVRATERLKTLAEKAGLLTPITAQVGAGGRVVPGSVAYPEWPEGAARPILAHSGRAPMYRFNATGPVESSWTKDRSTKKDPRTELAACTPDPFATSPDDLTAWAVQGNHTTITSTRSAV